MTKQVTTTNPRTICDFCPNEALDYRKCFECGRDFCSDHGYSLPHGVYTTGSGDGHYCKECCDKPEVNTSSLFRAYKTIVSLIHERRGFDNDFSERKERAEKEVERLSIERKRYQALKVS